MMELKTHRAKAVVNDITNFVKGLDRTPLGDFAYPENALISIGIYLEASAEMTHIDISHNSHNAKVLTEMSYLHTIHKGNSFAIGEWIFWRDHAGLYGSDTAKARTDVAQFRLVFDYPEFHDYFRAGIWDVDAIRKYAEHGIDAELALSMVRS